MFRYCKRDILFFTFISIFQFTYNQDILLSYSIQWKEKELYLLNYDKPEIPFLCLKYENIGKDSIYFYSGTDETENFLNINYHTGFMINVKIEDEWKKIHDSLPDWSEKEYKIYSLNNFSREFMVSQRKSIIDSSHSFDTDTDEHYVLDKLTSLLRYQKNLDRDSGNFQLDFFYHPNKKPECIDNARIFKLKESLLKEQLLMKKLMSDSLLREKWHEEKTIRNCMFLKPGESKYIVYDLTPLFLLKGTYHFIFKPLNLKKLHKNYDYELMPVINGFKLYKGTINGLKFTLKIPACN